MSEFLYSIFRFTVFALAFMAIGNLVTDLDGDYVFLAAMLYAAIMDVGYSVDKLLER